MLTELSALLDLLKAKGVTRMRLEPFDGRGFCGAAIIDVTFGRNETLAPSPEGKEPDLAADSPVDSDTCRCGHALSEHTNGLCLHACDVEQCAPVED